MLLLTAAAPESAAADCFSAASLEVQLLNKRFANAALLIEVDGPEKDFCQTSGTGVLVSSSGHVLTARHVVQRPGCSKTGIFARFPWDSETKVEMEVAVLAAHDAAFLRPIDVANWPQPRSAYCTAPLTPDEGQHDETFLRFGYNDRRRTPYGYAGNVIASAAETGQPPMQLVCTVMRKGDSGGPLFSIPSGDLMGITIRRREKDQFGEPVGNQGYILPLHVLNQNHPDMFDQTAECPAGQIVNIGMADLSLDIPYELVLTDRPAGGAAGARIVSATFNPVFGYEIANIVGVGAHDVQGAPLTLPDCQEAAVRSCLDVEIRNGSLSVTVRTISGAEVHPHSVVVYTAQNLAAQGLKWLEASKPDLSGQLARGELRAADAPVILEALVASPDAKAFSGAAVTMSVDVPITVDTDAASTAANGTGAPDAASPAVEGVMESLEGSFRSMQDAVGKAIIVPGN